MKDLKHNARITIPEIVLSSRFLRDKRKKMQFIILILRAFFAIFPFTGDEIND